jgi:hypothetical protein
MEIIVQGVSERITRLHIIISNNENVCFIIGIFIMKHSVYRFFFLWHNSPTRTQDISLRFLDHTHTHHTHPVELF